MIFRTHLAFSFLISLLALKFLNININHILFVVIVLFSSVLPDIDISKSKIGKKSKPLSNLIGFIFGHRGLIHSIWPSLLLFFLFYKLKKDIFGFAILFGYLSHLILDMFNKTGIALFYPISKLRVNGFIKTKSLFENILFIILLILDILYTIKYIL